MRTSILHTTLLVIVALGFASAPALAIEFKTSKKQPQTFNFADRAGRNQAIFISRTPLEDITGTANGITGSVSFDPTNVEKTIAGSFSIDTKSMTTGIGMRDEHMKGEAWLDAGKYPTIDFKLKSVSNMKSSKGNTLEGTATGDFTMRGVTKTVTAPVTLVLMEENEKTKMRAPGDLLQLRSKFSLMLSDFGVKGSPNIVGAKVNDSIEVEVNIVGSNATK